VQLKWVPLVSNEARFRKNDPATEGSIRELLIPRPKTRDVAERDLLHVSFESLRNRCCHTRASLLTCRNGYCDIDHADHRPSGQRWLALRRRSRNHSVGAKKLEVHSLTAKYFRLGSLTNREVRDRHLDLGRPLQRHDRRAQGSQGRRRTSRPAGRCRCRRQEALLIPSHGLSFLDRLRPSALAERTVTSALPSSSAAPRCP
jgi:hypothetical protein